MATLMFPRLAGASAGLAAGLGVVVATAATVDAAFPAPKFKTNVPRFDQSTFGGRFAGMLGTMDPSTLLATDDQVKQAHRLLTDFESGASQGASSSSDGSSLDAKLWAAKKLRDSAMHPDTKEIIPRPFRMAGYVPFNGPGDSSRGSLGLATNEPPAPPQSAWA